MRLLCSRLATQSLQSGVLFVSVIGQTVTAGPTFSVAPSPAAVSSFQRISPCLTVGLALPTSCHSEGDRQRLRIRWRSETAPGLIHLIITRELETTSVLLIEDHFAYNLVHPPFFWISSHSQAWFRPSKTIQLTTGPTDLDPLFTSP